MISASSSDLTIGAAGETVSGTHGNIPSITFSAPSDAPSGSPDHSAENTLPPGNDSSVPPEGGDASSRPPEGGDASSMPPGDTGTVSKPATPSHTDPGYDAEAILNYYKRQVWLCICVCVCVVCVWCLCVYMVCVVFVC